MPNVEDGPPCDLTGVEKFGYVLAPVEENIPPGGVMVYDEPGSPGWVNLN